MLIYYLFLLVTIIFALLTNEHNKKIQIIIIMTVLTIIAGLRHYTIGSDTVSYMRFFQQAVTYGTSILENSRIEIGYNYIMIFFSKITDNFNVFLLFCSAFINGTIGYFIYKYSKQPMFSIIIFILLRYFFSEMNILREFLALCIILCSINLIENRKIIRYIFLITIASLFHITAILAFPLYLLYNKEFSKKAKIIITISTVVIFIFLSNVLIYVTNLLGTYSNYVESRLYSNNLASLLTLLINVCIYLFYKYEFNKNKKYLDDEEMKRYSFLLNVSFITIMLGLISYRINIFGRVAIYYNIFNILILPNTISLIKNSSTKYLCYAIVFILFFTSFATIMYLRPDWYLVSPYRFYWN